MESLFLSQTYKDAWDDYTRSSTSSSFITWDYVIITASNEQQAEGYRKQLEQRRCYLAEQTKFVVIPDKDNKRIGSGGATLAVLRYLASEGHIDFNNIRVLVIHSGGDSKRVPQYSALGKLFSPVPRLLPDGRPSTLFDEFLIAMSGVPARIQEGMVLLSGDVLLLFNPLQIDFSGNGAAVVSFKEDDMVGKNHGVFLGREGKVAQFLHKQSPEKLRAVGAVNEAGKVDIDTGVIIFSAEVCRALASLPDEFISEDVRLSLYGDFLYPMAEDSTLESYLLEAAEGEMNDQLKAARVEVWNAIHKYPLKLLRLAPAKFLHFGTSKEILKLVTDGIRQYEELGWSSQVASSATSASYLSIQSDGATVGAGTYLEVSYIQPGAVIGSNSIISFVDVKESVPSNVILHGLKLKDGRFTARILGIDDNPKESYIFGRDLGEPLWTATIYPVRDTIEEAVHDALILYQKVITGQEIEKCGISLRDSFNCADPDALIAWQKRMAELVQADAIAKKIRASEPAQQGSISTITPIQREWLEEKLRTAAFSEAIRLNYYIGKAIGGAEGEKYIAQSFKTIQESILSGAMQSLQENLNCKIVTNEVEVKLPLRVNFGGGWSDTPPYCNEHGGTVLNAAIKLNGQNPVQVKLQRLDEKKIVFASADMDVYGEFDSIENLQSVGNPYDPYVLQKAALLACGVIPSSGGDLETVLTRLGGGFRMDTEVMGVPKGSGLGTSSILAAGCVKALFMILGISYTEHDLYATVLCMEQIMSTGGGWQDQVGGVTDGIKYITSRPGLKQNLTVQHLKLEPETLKELNERFVLIYTGQRRLARNLLRDVVGRYIGNEPDTVYALNEIQRNAALQRFELERGNIDAFADLMSQHWELSKMIDSGSTNTLIEQIWSSVEDLIAGRMICGAGGGGFLQAVLKKGVSKEQVHRRLKELFQDFDVDVWDAEITTEGSRC